MLLVDRIGKCVFGGFYVGGENGLRRPSGRLNRAGEIRMIAVLCVTRVCFALNTAMGCCYFFEFLDVMNVFFFGVL